MRVEPVEGGEGVLAAVGRADEGLLAGVDADVDLVRGCGFACKKKGGVANGKELYSCRAYSLGAFLLSKAVCN